jgi:hypothetical protein
MRLVLAENDYERRPLSQVKYTDNPKPECNLLVRAVEEFL